jgi:selenocysteine lyase/cysteine desulfurase
MEGRGGTIAFNFFDVHGVCFDIRRIEELANATMISLRAGCFCNPGAAEMAYHLSQPEIGAFFQDKRGMSFDELRSRIRATYDKEYGATRISVGLSSNFADTFAFLQFAHGFLNKSIQDVGAYEATPESRTWMRDSA